MRDEDIIRLYFDRDERAIHETGVKYGVYCSTLAMRLLGIREDAEECVSDTYLAAWNKMPPERPGVLRTFLGRITRNIAISRYRRQRAAKRFAPMEAQLDELADCIPAEGDAQTELERRELGRAISLWLDGLSEAERNLFVRRYWYGCPVEELARLRGERSNTTAQKLRRLRLSLRDALEREN